jgi:hypothetical protein
MFFSWLRDRRRQRLLEEPFPKPWRDWLAANVRYYPHLDQPGRDIVEETVQVLVAEKHWTGGGGFVVSDEMKVTIAGQAALLVLGLDEPYYFDALPSIIVYPGRYLHPPQWSRRGIHLGEAWYRGPIVLSWKDVLSDGHNASRGRNLVLHEFAHYLDGLDGDVDGTPPLEERQQAQTWYRVTEAEYLRLVGQARRDEVSLLDHYGASNRAEFFAVATECFFERPHAMQEQCRDLYAVLQDFYREDPAKWLPDAAVATGGGRRADGRDDAAQVKKTRNARLKVLRSRDGEALFALAVEYLNGTRYALAARTLSRAIELHPDDAEAYQQRAWARVKLGRCREAIKDCDRSLWCDADDPATYRVRGAAYLGLGNYGEAMDDLDYAIKEDRDDADAHYLRGRVWAALGEHRRAAADFSRSLALHPLVAEVYYHSGLTNRELGRLDDAETDLAKAFQLDPLVDRRKRETVRR